MINADRDVVVVIPYRWTPDRAAAFGAVADAWYAAGYHLRVAGSDHSKSFNLAEARNRGVHTAELDLFNVVIVADADTIAEPEPVREAVEAARTSGLVHLPYTEYRTLGPIGTLQLQSGTPPQDCAHTVIPIACSGVFIATTQTWWSIGGMDERFTTWAPEDYAFRIAHQTLLGHDFVRHQGAVYAQHHNDQPDKGTGPAYDACVQHYTRYLEAPDKTAMRELVDGNLAQLHQAQ